ncbi:MAG: hypothetical protein MUF84_19860, partial [Anaerolineae bacterium]|nr:hypothetical protein [Anaerolineae bacterium]
LSLHCGIIWSHTSSIDLAGQTVTYSDIQGGYTGTGNLNVDPLFVAAGSSNYHLQNGSPLIDRCPTFSGLGTDFDNEARPVVRVSLATPYDMGADETTPARVGINGAACAYGSIRDAVTVASPGDALYAMAGTFYENIDIAGKSLTLAGGYAADCATPGAGSTTVNGLSGGGSVFDIAGGTVLLRGLSITGGDAIGGGVDVGSGTRVTLDNVDVFGNTGAQGGGVWIDTGAVVTATNDSDIYNNTAATDGGGVRVWGRFYGVGNESDVYDNQAPSGGGFSVPGGHVFLNAADVYGNQATGTLGKGGGMHVSSGGLVTLTNSVFIYFGNTAYDGAGIYADNASVTMTNSTFRDNTATNDGGALYLTNNSVMQATGVSIGQDTTGLHNEAVRGAGIYAITSTVTMIGGRIINNLASSSGGGLYASNSTVNLTGATVGGTGANQANLLGPSGHEGVGLFLTANTRAVLSNTVVSSNTFQSTLYTYGGGAMVDAGSVLTLTNSRVERHLAPDTFDGRGAGLYVRDATVTLDNSQVISNTAGTVGGGVRMYGGKLNVINGSSLINNRTLTGEGGAIAATYDVSAPDINVRGATFGNNAAGTHGGAIYLDAGTLDFSEGWTLRENTAGSNGGAVAIVGTGDARFSAGSYSLAYYNRALGGDGGFIYLTNATTAELHATSGYQMYVYANQASGNGGALYADSGGLFDVYGQVNFDRNRADHGGAIYLANASRIWLDDHSEIGPELWDNWADYGSGGAIYASNSPRVECDGATLGRTDDGNHATADGGALFLSGSTLDSDNCLFLYNEAAANGGAIAAYTSTLNLHATYGSPMTIAAGELDVRDGLAPLALAATACDPALGLCSAFFENVANSDGDTTGYGGAIYNNDGMLVVSHTVLYTNTAYYGGAIYQAGTNAHAEVNNTLIYSNTAGVALGAGIRSTGGTFSITHTTLANNINGAGYSQSSTTSEVHNSIAWGNTAGGFWVASGILNGTCSLDQSGNAGPATDPHFVDAAHWDFHLLGDSPAIDACATGLPVDLDNVARPFGAGYDMGAFEWFVRTVFLPLVVRN